MGEKEEKRIRVVDRRMFTSDGELRPDFVPEEPSGSSDAPPPPPPRASASAAGSPVPEPAAAPAPAETRPDPAPAAPASPGGPAAGEMAPDDAFEGTDEDIGEPASDAPQEPRSEFAAIVRSLATTAYSALGLLPDPSGARHREPAVARQMIDWLAVLESKTRNNLSFEETDFLSRVLYELRLAFVEVTRPPGAAK